MATTFPFSAQAKIRYIPTLVLEYTMAEPSTPKEGLKAKYIDRLFPTLRSILSQTLALLM